jgi:WD40 repeat protein
LRKARTAAFRDAVGAVAFSPDGKAVLTASRDQAARLWDVSKRPYNHERISTCVVTS